MKQMRTVEEHRKLAHALIQAVDDYGHEYVYPYTECVYFNEDGPACLIGVALDKAGFTQETVLSCTSQGWENTNEETARVVVNALGFNQKFASACSEAQAVQDEKLSWGKALRQFRDFIGYLGIISLVDEKDWERLSKVD